MEHCKAVLAGGMPRVGEIVEKLSLPGFLSLSKETLVAAQKCAL